MNFISYKMHGKDWSMVVGWRWNRACKRLEKILIALWGGVGYDKERIAKGCRNPGSFSPADPNCQSLLFSLSGTGSLSFAVSEPTTWPVWWPCFTFPIINGMGQEPLILLPSRISGIRWWCLLEGKNVHVSARNPVLGHQIETPSTKNICWKYQS